MDICPHLCFFVPVFKSNKDLTDISNYRLIALASTLSKMLEWFILIKFEDCFKTSNLQFRFKPGLSTTLYTGVVKRICTLMILVFQLVQEGGVLSPIVFSIYLDTLLLSL